MIKKKINKCRANILDAAHKSWAVLKVYKEFYHVYYVALIADVSDGTKIPADGVKG